MKKRIELGARVQAADKQTVGTVEKIVVDPDQHEPAYLVIKRGRIRPRHVVVPVTLVTKASPEEIVLATAGDDLKSFPDYEVAVKHGTYQKPIPAGRWPDVVYTPPSNRGYMVLKQRSVPATSVSVERGMAVVDAAGLRVGAVDGLVLDRDRRQATDVVVRHVEPMVVRRSLVPVDPVADVRNGDVHLRITTEHVYGLAVYRPAPEDSERL